MEPQMSILNKFFPEKQSTTPKAGLYHLRDFNDIQGNRLHLRVEKDGSGILMVNASRIVYLNPTSVEYIKLIFDGKNEEEIQKHFKKYYKVSDQQITNDYNKIITLIHNLIDVSGVCPILFLDTERIEPFSTPVSAPYRMDLALTYRCNNHCLHCYVERDSAVKELSKEEWKQVIDKLWEIGIPHICFTGGEATSVEFLPELIDYAENVGLVTGILTNGRRFSDENYTKLLAEKGLDHLQITLESHNEAIHNKMVCDEGWAETAAGIKNALKYNIYTITNTTLTPLNSPTIEGTITFLKSLGINTFACNGLIYSGKAPESGLGIEEKDLDGILERVQRTAKKLDMHFIWYTPTHYCLFNPIDAEIGIKRCTAAQYNMCIEPNGDVLPCQSYFESLGNILRDGWDSIWNNPLSVEIRERKNLPSKCLNCDNFSLCGGGCPIYNKNKEVLCIESKSNI